jgi:hypothetical protein
MAGLVAAVALAAGLRLVLLDRPPTLSPDEAYSAHVASLPLGEIVSYVRATDPHPPLSYLLLAPVAAWSSYEAMLRLPSALCSIAAVGVMAWWQRPRAAEGVMATALFAVLPLAVSYGVQARMYGLLELAGVAAAAGAARWLETGCRRWLTLAVGAATVAAFSHATGCFLLLGLLMAPGRRHPRSTEWRLAVAGGLGLFGLAWGATALAQRDGSLYRLVTPESVAVTVNETIAARPAIRWLGVAVLAAGVVSVVARRGNLARVLVAAYLAPLLVALAVGTRVGLFIPKTLVVLEWGVAVALAGAVAVTARWRPPAGAVVAVLVLALVVPAVPPTLDPPGAEMIVGRLRSVVRDGDVVANHPLDNVLRWYVFRDPEGRLRPAPPIGWPDTVAAKVGDAPFSGRVWLVDSTYLRAPLVVIEPLCAVTEDLAERRSLRCVLLGPVPRPQPG